MRAGGSEPWDLGMLHQALVSAATIGPDQSKRCTSRGDWSRGGDLEDLRAQLPAQIALRDWKE